MILKGNFDPKLVKSDRTDRNKTVINQRLTTPFDFSLRMPHNSGMDRIEINLTEGNPNMKQDLVVDYEDQADWLQDSVVIENVEIRPGMSHEVFLAELKGLVYDATRDRYDPPSRHIEIMGYAPADSDVTVKRGVNFWTSPDNIFA